ncbi:hypothetical protein BDZ89DRAFT_922420, partial [Hymenopellis radicata]
GYCLPDPNAIVSATKEGAVSGQLRSLCKPWDILLYRMTSRHFQVLKPREWRTILIMEHTSTTPGTKAAQNRQAMGMLLNACLDSATKEGRLAIDNWSAQPVKWHGQQLEQLDPAAVRPILWELAEVSFRWELVCLDSFLY